MKGNLNPFNTTLPVAYAYVKSIESLFNSRIFTQNLRNIKASIYANSSLGATFMNQIGFTLDNMLLTCVYANQPTCSSSDFQSFTSYDRGNCFTFNANTSNISTLSQTGQYYGLRLELFSGSDG